MAAEERVCAHASSLKKRSSSMQEEKSVRGSERSSCHLCGASHLQEQSELNLCASWWANELADEPLDLAGSFLSLSFISLTKCRVHLVRLVRLRCDARTSFVKGFSALCRNSYMIYVWEHIIGKSFVTCPGFEPTTFGSELATSHAISTTHVVN